MSARAVITAAFLGVVLLAGAPDAKAGENAGAAATPSASQRLDIDNAVNGQVGKCWSAPQPLKVHSVTVRFELKRDGSLVAGPAIIEKTPPNAPDVAAQAVIAAVRNCLPLKLPPNAYDYWRHVQIKFVFQPQPEPIGRAFGPSEYPN